MFDNIGGKIKTLAKAVTWIGIIGSVIWGIRMITLSASYSGMYGSRAGGGSALVGILVMALGSLVSWISSFILYGFGDLVENAKRAADALERKL